jgi:hypothetical protein
VNLLAALAACMGLLAGSLGGFGLAKRSQRWCPGCGLTITTEHCPHRILNEVRFQAHGRTGAFAAREGRS